MKKEKIIIILIIFLYYIKSYEIHELKLNKDCTSSEERKYCGDELICIDSKCQSCKNTTQCQEEKHYLYKCLKTKTNNEKIGICVHKNLLPEYSLFDILSSIFTFVGGALSSAGGIGGGGIFVPIFSIIGQFKTSLAIPISKATIFGASLCNFLILVPQKYQLSPYITKSLIDYDAALILEPFTLCGTVIGVFLNVMCPEWVILILLFILLSLVSLRSFKKGVDLYKVEKIKGKIEGEDLDSELKESLIDIDEKEKKIKKQKEVFLKNISTRKDLKEEEKSKLLKILKEESKFPPFKFMAIFFVWISIFILSLLKGGHGAQSLLKIQPCSFWYWFIVFLIFPISIFIGMIGAYFSNKKYRLKKIFEYKFQIGEIKWNKFHSFIIPIFATFAGIFAGMLGIGGGMVKSPLLIELGVNARVSTATSLFMILFTSSITTIQYIILGRLPYDYGIYFILVGFFSALCGQFLLGWFIKKYKKQSIIIFILAISIGIATFLLVGTGLYNLIIDIFDGVYMGFKLPC